MPHSTRAVRGGRGGRKSRCSVTQATRARALFRAWPNSTRHRVWPRPGGSCRCTKVGYSSIPNLCTGSRSTLRQGPPGDHQGSLWFLWSHSRTKYLSQGDESPARGACREGHSRYKTPKRGACREAQQEHLKEPAAARHASRQDPASDKFPGRQDNGRGKALATAGSHSVPALQLTHLRVAPGPFPAYVAGGCAARGTLWHARLTGSPSWRAITPLTVPFLHRLGDVDGHLMPLSPAVRVRYDTLCR